MSLETLFGPMPEQRKPTRFGEFWGHYPKKVAKRHAEKCYHLALERGAREADIIAGAMRYAAQCDHTADRFIKHPGTWLNRDCWTDPAPKERRSFLDIATHHEPDHDDR